MKFSLIRLEQITFWWSSQFGGHWTLSQSPALCRFCRSPSGCRRPDLMTEIALFDAFLPVYPGCLLSVSWPHCRGSSPYPLWLWWLPVPAGDQLLTFLESPIFCVLPVKTKSIPIVPLMMYFLYCILLFWAIGYWRLYSPSLATGSSIHISFRIKTLKGLSLKKKKVSWKEESPLA